MSRAAKWFYLAAYYILRLGCALGWHDWEPAAFGFKVCMTCDNLKAPRE